MVNHFVLEHYNSQTARNFPGMKALDLSCCYPILQGYNLVVQDHFFPLLQVDCNSVEVGNLVAGHDCDAVKAQSFAVAVGHSLAVEVGHSSAGVKVGHSSAAVKVGHSSAAAAAGHSSAAAAAGHSSAAVVVGHSSNHDFSVVSHYKMHFLADMMFGLSDDFACFLPVSLYKVAVV